MQPTTRRTHLILQTVAALGFLTVSLVWFLSTGQSVKTFLNSLAGTLAGASIAAASAWIIWLLNERDPDIPEEFGLAGAREIRRQSYFARGLVLGLTATEKQLAFEISALVVPVTLPARCRIFGVSDLKWQGKKLRDYWQLGGSEALKDPASCRGQTKDTDNSQVMSYVYVFEFAEPQAAIEDDHVFSFFCDSVRIEALLSGNRGLKVRCGDKVLDVIQQKSPQPDLRKFVCVAPRPWVPGDRLHWQITES
jgi:hypothetical protein